ncbi:Uncharacterized ACR (DUF711) [Fragilaria crotonensis]|nr:Uncharacterized ACR (DUF711) [Fragilaria crotonensis]
MPTASPVNTNHLFRVRTITAFVQLSPEDFESSSLENKIQKCSQFLSSFHSFLTTAGYEVQTLRMATNPFGQYLVSQNSSEGYLFTNRLDKLDDLLDLHNISLCALGPATTLEEIALCPTIVAHSSRWSCSAAIPANNVSLARATADCILQISKLEQKHHNTCADSHPGGRNCASVEGGIGNFRFCGTASCCSTAQIPFFPAASASDTQYPFSFALGLENGPLAYHLLEQCRSIANLPTTFLQGMDVALQPLEDLCQAYSASSDDIDNNATDWAYLGIDTSLNPALDCGVHGSVASALETLDEVSVFAGPGTVAAAAAVTVALQNLPNITTTGYCGFMLPVCEDLRLAELASSDLRISNLLSISAVCGVGVDTVPIEGDVSPGALTSLLLDVANLAARWNKPLSCRVFPVPGKRAGERTNFDSPYLCNSSIFSIK